jgi:hypothetical protein
VGADGRVNCVELRSGRGHRTNAYDRDQRGDQAIFNRGDARLVPGDVQAGTTNGGENDEARRIAAYIEAAGAFVSMIE